MSSPSSPEVTPPVELPKRKRGRPPGSTKAKKAKMMEMDKANDESAARSSAENVDSKMDSIDSENAQDTEVDADRDEREAGPSKPIRRPKGSYEARRLKMMDMGPINGGSVETMESELNWTRARKPVNFFKAGIRPIKSRNPLKSRTAVNLAKTRADAKSSTKKVDPVLVRSVAMSSVNKVDENLDISDDDMALDEDQAVADEVDRVSDQSVDRPTNNKVDPNSDESDDDSSHSEALGEDQINQVDADSDQTVAGSSDNKVVPDSDQPISEPVDNNTSCVSDSSARPQTENPPSEEKDRTPLKEDATPSESPTDETKDEPVPKPSEDKNDSTTDPIDSDNKDDQDTNQSVPPPNAIEDNPYAGQPEAEPSKPKSSKRGRPAGIHRPKGSYETRRLKMMDMGPINGGSVETMELSWTRTRKPVDMFQAGRPIIKNRNEPTSRTRVADRYVDRPPTNKVDTGLDQPVAGTSDENASSDSQVTAPSSVNDSSTTFQETTVKTGNPSSEEGDPTVDKENVIPSESPSDKTIEEAFSEQDQSVIGTSDDKAPSDSHDTAPCSVDDSLCAQPKETEEVENPLPEEMDQTEYIEADIPSESPTDKEIKDELEANDASATSIVQNEEPSNSETQPPVRPSANNVESNLDQSVTGSSDENAPTDSIVTAPCSAAEPENPPQEEMDLTEYMESEPSTEKVITDELQANDAITSTTSMVQNEEPNTSEVQPPVRPSANNVDSNFDQSIAMPSVSEVEPDLNQSVTGPPDNNVSVTPVSAETQIPPSEDNDQIELMENAIPSENTVEKAVMDALLEQVDDQSVDRKSDDNVLFGSKIAAQPEEMDQTEPMEETIPSETPAERAVMDALLEQVEDQSVNGPSDGNNGFDSQVTAPCSVDDSLRTQPKATVEVENPPPEEMDQTEYLEADIPSESPIDEVITDELRANDAITSATSNVQNAEPSYSEVQPSVRLSANNVKSNLDQSIAMPSASEIERDLNQSVTGPPDNNVSVTPATSETQIPPSEDNEHIAPVEVGIQSEIPVERAIMDALLEQVEDQSVDKLSDEHTFFDSQVVAVQPEEMDQTEPMEEAALSETPPEIKDDAENFATPIVTNAVEQNQKVIEVEPDLDGSLDSSLDGSVDISFDGSDDLDDSSVLSEDEDLEMEDYSSDPEISSDTETSFNSETSSDSETDDENDPLFKEIIEDMTRRDEARAAEGARRNPTRQAEIEKEVQEEVERFTEETKGMSAFEQMEKVMNDMAKREKDRAERERESDLREKTRQEEERKILKLEDYLDKLPRLLRSFSPNLSKWTTEDLVEWIQSVMDKCDAHVVQNMVNIIREQGLNGLFLKEIVDNKEKANEHFVLQPGLLLRLRNSAKPIYEKYLRLHTNQIKIDPTEKDFCKF